MKQNHAVRKYNRLVQKPHEVLRLTGENGWANYKYAAPFDADAKATNGKCQHIVFMDSNLTPVPDGTTVSACTIEGKESIKLLHFDTAEKALEAMRTLIGNLKEKQNLWIEDGFIHAQFV